MKSLKTVLEILDNEDLINEVGCKLLKNWKLFPETKEMILSKLKEIAANKKVELLEYRRFSEHKDDDYLYVVLCKINDMKYVTWVANIEEGCEGFFVGNYFESYNGKLTSKEIYERALLDYEKRK